MSSTLDNLTQNAPGIAARRAKTSPFLCASVPLAKRVVIFSLLIALAAVANGQVRIKDIAGVQGARSNQLVGYGIVIGLDGSGDSNSTIFTAQSVVNTLQKMGMTVPGAAVKVKNVAAVMVTAELPAFVKNGSKIDVTVSSIGDARSIQGGTLIQTPLKAADGEVYAVAQGSVSIGGFNISAGGAQAQKNHVTAGRIPAGANVEREVPTSLSDGSSLEITLRKADATTATRIAEAINAKNPASGARAVDPYTVRVGIPEANRGDLVGYIAQLEGLMVTPDTSAKIIVNEKTGTVVIGGDVRIRPCAISHGSIEIKVDNTPVVVPAPPGTLLPGKTTVVPQKDVTVKEKQAHLVAIPATTSVDDLVKALNKLGVTPRDLIAILQAMQPYISAEIEIQ
jgi:flagellar P-ring protein precursor FlgI